MALLFADGFDHYAFADITQYWTQVYAGPPTDPSIGAFGRRGTNGLRCQTTTATNNAVRPVGAVLPNVSGDTCFVGFSFKSNDHANLGTTILSDDPNLSGTFDRNMGLLFIRHTSTTQVFISLNASGQVTAYRGTTLLGTSTAALAVGVEHFLEIKVVIHNSTGSIEVRANGGTILSLSGVDTQQTGSATWDEVVLGKAVTANSNQITWDFDDFSAHDGSGSNWNTFMGDHAWKLRLPTANGTTRDWTPSTGTDDFAVVDDVPPDGDTSYLEAANVGDLVTMGFEDADIDGASIDAVVVVAQIEKTDAGTAGHKAALRISGTDYLSAEKAVPSTYALVPAIFELNPATSAPFTETIFNGMEIGAEKSA